MSDEEVVNYLKENDEIITQLKILALINVIVNAMITKGWFSEEEFNKSYEVSLDNLLIEIAKRISSEERHQIKLIKKLDNKIKEKLSRYEKLKNIYKKHRTRSNKSNRFIIGTRTF